MPGAMSARAVNCMWKLDHSANSTCSKATPVLAVFLKFFDPAQCCPGLGGIESQVSMDGMNDTAYISSISHLRMCFDIQWVISSLQQTCWEHGTNIPYPIFLWRKLRMQRSKQIFPKSHSWYRGNLDSNLHRLDSKAYDHSTLTCCLTWMG